MFNSTYSHFEVSAWKLIATYFLPAIERRFTGLVILSVMSTLAGCYYPKAVDDFSVLNNDVFSNLLRNSYESENGLSGSGQFDEAQLKILVDNLIFRAMAKKIEAGFVRNDE
ncbi:hypothetical protein PO883_06115 [Massilia sp. DJPM01]|uniref:hypothetical protein n=1 Tax=Massilia sp. DJPM01 TaxID=3024404 RepID=UPI00259DD0F0|nr:hypothetical protein [Massilia sp. DJPM01]MDM5176770.1 hypothetical protein [Massilia sp. DJPM01]